MPNLVPLPGSDWTDFEPCQIERLHELCRSTPNWKLDCGRSDEGDPWCVICDNDLVVFHIARIDRAYVAACERKRRIYRSLTTEDAVDIAIDELTATLCGLQTVEIEHRPGIVRCRIMVRIEQYHQGNNITKALRNARDWQRLPAMYEPGRFYWNSRLCSCVGLARHKG